MSADEKHKLVFPNARDWLENTAQKIKAAMDRLAWSHPEVRALKNNVDYISRAAMMYETAPRNAVKNYQSTQEGLYNAAAQDADVKAYQKAMENAFTDEDAQAERDALAVNLFMRAEKGWIKKHADLYEDGLEKFKQALTDYGTGKVALNKALRDQGLEDAPADMNAALAYAGRQLEKGNKSNVKLSIQQLDDTAMEESQYNVGELLQYTSQVMWDVLEASPGVLVEQDETTKEIIKELNTFDIF